jgi:hypothetical protein
MPEGSFRRECVYAILYSFAWGWTRSSIPSIPVPGKLDICASGAYNKGVAAGWSSGSSLGS